MTAFPRVPPPGRPAASAAAVGGPAAKWRAQVTRRCTPVEPIGCAVVSDLVLAEDRGAVRHVVLNRPEKRNALNEELVAAIGAALRAAADDAAVRCVVVRGAGRVFS